MKNVNIMFYGLMIGMMYGLFGFRKVKEPPIINITWGPFVNGHLIVCNRHIHHWMVYSITGILSCIFHYWNICGFSLVMTIQGLSYSDRLDFT